MESPEPWPVCPFSCAPGLGRAGSLAVPVLFHRGDGTALGGQLLQAVRRTPLWVWVFLVQPFVGVSGFSCSHTEQC